MLWSQWWMSGDFTSDLVIRRFVDLTDDEFTGIFLDNVVARFCDDVDVAGSRGAFFLLFGELQLLPLQIQLNLLPLILLPFVRIDHLVGLLPQSPLVDPSDKQTRVQTDGEQEQREDEEDDIQPDVLKS